MEMSHNNDVSRTGQFPFGQPAESGFDYEKPYAASDPDYTDLGAGDITDEDPSDEVLEPETPSIAATYDITATDDEPEPARQPERPPEREPAAEPDPSVAAQPVT